VTDLFAELETPVPAVDLERLSANIARAARYAADHRLGLRPHIKTHKSPRLAAEQLEAGAVGLTCATPYEAEVMSAVTDDLLLAYPPVGPLRARRIAALPDHVRLTVALDSAAAVDDLATAARAAGREVGVYVELDLGMHRVGLPIVDDAIALARRVGDARPLRFAGIAFYPGHIREAVDSQDAKLAALGNALSDALAQFDRAGIHPDAVSGGSTPTMWRTHELPAVTEFRPGTYIFNDRTTAEIGAQACAGLDYAHRRGIIHRDVKPGNLMVVGGPVGGGAMTVKLTDFGIARAVEQTRITQVGSVVGTAAYLSPEQVRGEEATPATDVYALGVVLYQFLTGRLPYEGSSLAELAVRQQNETPLPPSTYDDSIPETLGGAVLRALEGDPARRYASASELAGGLALGMQGEDVTLPPGEGSTPTRVLGGETATRRLDRTAQTEFRPAPSPTRRPVARAPVSPPPPAPAQAPVHKKRGAFSRFARFVMVLVALVLIAAAVAAAVIYTTDKATGVKATEVAGNTVDKVVEEFKELVKKNTE